MLACAGPLGARVNPIDAPCIRHPYFSYAQSPPRGRPPLQLGPLPDPGPPRQLAPESQPETHIFPGCARLSLAYDSETTRSLHKKWDICGLGRTCPVKLRLELDGKTMACRGVGSGGFNRSARGGKSEQHTVGHRPRICCPYVFCFLCLDRDVDGAGRGLDRLRGKSVRSVSEQSSGPSTHAPVAPAPRPRRLAGGCASTALGATIPRNMDLSWSKRPKIPGPDTTVRRLTSPYTHPTMVGPALAVHLIAPDGRCGCRQWPFLGMPLKPWGAGDTLGEGSGLPSPPRGS